MCFAVASGEPSTLVCESAWSNFSNRAAQLFLLSLYWLCRRSSADLSTGNELDATAIFSVFEYVNDKDNAGSINVALDLTE